MSFSRRSTLASSPARSTKDEMHPRLSWASATAAVGGTRNRTDSDIPQTVQRLVQHVVGSDASASAAALAHGSTTTIAVATPQSSRPVSTVVASPTAKTAANLHSVLSMHSAAALEQLYQKLQIKRSTGVLERFKSARGRLFGARATPTADTTTDSTVAHPDDCRWIKKCKIPIIMLPEMLELLESDLDTLPVTYLPTAEEQRWFAACLRDIALFQSPEQRQSEWHNLPRYFSATFPSHKHDTSPFVTLVLQAVMEVVRGVKLFKHNQDLLFPLFDLLVATTYKNSTALLAATGTDPNDSSLLMTSAKAPLSTSSLPESYRSKSAKISASALAHSTFPSEQEAYLCLTLGTLTPFRRVVCLLVLRFSHTLIAVRNMHQADVVNFIVMGLLHSPGTTTFAEKKWAEEVSAWLVRMSPCVLPAPSEAAPAKDAPAQQPQRHAESAGQLYHSATTMVGSSQVQAATSTASQGLGQSLSPLPDDHDDDDIQLAPRD